MRALRNVSSVAAMGAAAGLVLSSREVLRQHWLAEDLWRTALWRSARGAYLGLIGGLAASALVLLMASLWLLLLRYEDKRRGDLDEARRGLPRLFPSIQTLVLSLVALGSLVLALSPVDPGHKFGLPFRDLVLSLLALIVTASSGLAISTVLHPAPSAPAGGQSAVMRLAALAAGWLVVFLHIWARATSTLTLISLGLATIIAFVGLGYLFDRRVRAPNEAGQPPAVRPPRKLGTAAAIAVLALTAGLSAGSWLTARAARAQAAERHLNVILIGIDTLRADRASLLSAESYRRDLTPNIRRLLGDRATIYAQAISQAPWTLPAFASILTGLYPAEHGAEFRGSTLASRQVTLPEILREAGFRTMGVSSGCYVTRAAGLAQGFELFDESQALGQRTITSSEVSDRAIRLLRDFGGEPFFLFVHYYEPHWVYYDHQDYHYADGYEGRLREPARQLNQEDFREYVGALRPGFSKRSMPPEDVAFLEDLYDEDIAFMDRELGRLLEYVNEANLRQNTLVIFVSDHGEEFLEHRGLGHQTTVYQELVHVPLAVASPSGPAPRVVSSPVETRWLFRTILDFLGVEWSGPAASAHSLRTATDEPVRTATHATAVGADGRLFPEPVDVWWTSLQDERWKLVKEHLRGRSMLFDLAKDPGETRECSAQHADQKRRLERELDRLDLGVRRASPGPGPEATEEQQRKLKTLGYL